MNSTNTVHDQSVILLFEDEKTLCRTIRFTLTRLGYSVALFSIADDATHILRCYELAGKQISVIITDIQRNSKTGLDLIKAILSANNTIPILVVAGHGYREIRDELNKIGVHNILDKPFIVDELINKIQSMIQTNPGN